MDHRGDEIHASTTEASGGSREGVVRWVLVIGLVLVIAAFAIILATGMLSQDNGADSQVNQSREMAAQEDMNADRGEPMAPAFDADTGATGTQQSNAAPDAAPSSAATPGDAPAGDPTNTAQ
ncbi:MULTISPECIES: hypothetical protein [Bacteria]|uniref:hypothetical protein n=1 Tax=Bacteria TaxID=2 RepID=UPI00103EFD5D|nr:MULTISPECIES: hypothetical protein [Bacteria]QDM41762.1 hypothetical protein C0V74_12475 [Altererythrobacter sp. TH136]TCJ38345.1 hypothetical protein E0504_15415 [Parafrankia sp. BMG5.11]